MTKTPSRRLLVGAGLWALGWLGYALLARYQDGKVLPAGFDPLLAALPRLDGDFLMTWVFLAFNGAIMLYWALKRRERLGYFLAMVGLWTFVRAVFIALTPVGPPRELVHFYGGSLAFLRGKLFFDSELFFSGHTGLPYLYSLLAGSAVALRRGCLLFSVVMGAGVLLTRNHFPIDVLGAYFMTYSTWTLGKGLFSRLDAAGAA